LTNVSVRVSLGKQEFYVMLENPLQWYV